MIANLLIGLREGLEAALIIGILAAYLIKIEQRHRLKALMVGTLVAVGASVAFGLVLNFAFEEVPAGTNEIISGGASIVAVIFVTYMIFWMARQSKNMSGELRARMDHLKAKTAIGVASLAFFAVIREGFETSVFIWSAIRATGSDTAPIIGAVFGLALAAIMGYLIFLGSLKINLSKFFGYTGAFLIVVAAGIFGYGVHEFQEIGLLPFLTETAWDMSGVITPNGFVDTLLRGTISFRSAPSWLEAIVWFGYLIPTSIIFWKTSTKRK